MIVYKLINANVSCEDGKGTYFIET